VILRLALRRRHWSRPAILDEHCLLPNEEEIISVCFSAQNEDGSISTGGSVVTPTCSAPDDIEVLEPIRIQVLRGKTIGYF
jgi:hypothetical protein